MTPDKAIFFDERERRWRRARGVLAAVAVVAAALLSIFTFTVFEGPELPAGNADTERPGAATVLSASNASGAPLRWLSRDRGTDKDTPLRLAFYVADDAASLRSLQAHHGDLDVLAPALLHAVSVDGHLAVGQDAQLSAWLLEGGRHVAVMPVVDDFDGQAWRGAEVADVLARDASRRTLIGELERYAAEHRSAGVVVDFEEVPASGQPALRQFARELSSRLHARGRRLLMALPARDPAYDYAELGRICDAIVLRSEEHTSELQSRI